MDAELTLDVVSARDDATPARDGTVSRFKRVEFYLGKYGPFVERLTDEQYHSGEFDRRVRQLRATLQSHQGL